MHSTDSLRSISAINAMSEAEFIDRFGDLYEHSAWAAQATYAALPVNSREELMAAFADSVANAALARKQALVNAHPELASTRLAALTQSSQREQQGAGLNTLDGSTQKRFQALNQSYRERHGFPFIIAVAGLDADAILAALEERLPRTSAEEFSTALQQIDRIASHRLAQRVG